MNSNFLVNGGNCTVYKRTLRKFTIIILPINIFIDSIIVSLTETFCRKEISVTRIKSFCKLGDKLCWEIFKFLSK